MLPQETVEELKTIVREDYGVCLDDAQAIGIADTLVSYFEILMEVNHECYGKKQKDN